EAVHMITTLKPDLLFLDIQMPEMNGFEVLQKIPAAQMPIVVFVTAFDQYAIRAFEYHALDYLLKPIREDRFNEAIQAACSEVHKRNLEQYVSRLQSAVNAYLSDAAIDVDSQPDARLRSSQPALMRLTVKSKNQISLLDVREIDWIESAGDYVYVHTRSHKHLVRETLVSLEERLDPRLFVRIHRSVIANIEQISTLKPNDHGDFDIYLKSGVKLKMSRTYRAHFEHVTGNLL
ncbi:MAG TPA: LytTR family DNA-binding domain-containing protein, partial [Bacteroidota bacterium]|nr:LytTR family DNA-binding domain-containing protein [Bacteroidota bacterium]